MKREEMPPPEDRRESCLIEMGQLRGRAKKTKVLRVKRRGR